MMTLKKLSIRLKFNNKGKSKIKNPLDILSRGDNGTNKGLLRFTYSTAKENNMKSETSYGGKSSFL
jgi:hypothetical protein